MDWRVKATEEKSLLEVYIKARKIASSRSNLLVALAMASLFFFLGYADRRFAGGIFQLEDQSAIINKITDLGFSFTTAILGFLIAGFSIFASITRPEIFKGLAKLDHEGTDLTRLKFIFFNFLFVFIHYLAFLAFVILVEIIFPATKDFVSIIVVQGIVSIDNIWWAAIIGNTLAIGWLVFLIMLLKSFIWNIYQSVLLIIVTGDLLAKINDDVSE